MRVSQFVTPDIHACMSCKFYTPDMRLARVNFTWNSCALCSQDNTTATATATNLEELAQAVLQTEAREA